MKYVQYFRVPVMEQPKLQCLFTKIASTGTPTDCACERQFGYKNSAFRWGSADLSVCSAVLVILAGLADFTPVIKALEFIRKNPRLQEPFRYILCHYALHEVNLVVDKRANDSLRI